MDIFKEQIVKINGTAVGLVLRVLIWFVAVILAVAALVFLGGFGALIGFGLLYGAWFLAQHFSIEYEYILTNGDLDIDKITAKRTRKRLCTIKCSEIESIAKYTQGMQLNKDVLVCGNLDNDAYYLRARTIKGAAVSVIISPNEKMKEAIRTYIPRIIQRDAFN